MSRPSVLRAIFAPPSVPLFPDGSTTAIRAIRHSPDIFFSWRVGRCTIRLHTRGLVKFGPSVGLRLDGSGHCYCGHGGMMFECHLFGVARWLSVEWLPRPCSCDDAAAAFCGEEG